MESTPRPPALTSILVVGGFFMAISAYLMIPSRDVRFYVRCGCRIRFA